LKHLSKVKYEDFLNSISKQKVITVKKKRERAVYFLPESNKFFKLWVPNWTQGLITSFCIEQEFYNANNAQSVIELIEDESGPRGYVQIAGVSAAEPGKSDKDWSMFNRMTSLDKRKTFIQNVFRKSIEIGGTYTDLAPCNLIFYNDTINFIDLESFRSFDLIYENKRKDYEKFDLDAWWKPHETAKRDVNKYLKSYLSECLGLDLQFDIDSKENFKKTAELVYDC
tara:strand:+ start:43192 stop:43869 length:678 start_codon:yes stop_codon:yes gene_type:complete